MLKFDHDYTTKIRSLQSVDRFSVVSSVQWEVADRTQNAVALRGVTGEAQLVLPGGSSAGVMGVAGVGSAGRNTGRRMRCLVGRRARR